MVGHDINYISIAGALGAIGRPGQKPAIPLNILADYAGGGTMAAFSIAAALLARDRIGRGQYIDLAMSDGVLYLLASAVSDLLAGGEAPRPGAGRLSGANPHYDVYETADGGWISLGAQEAQFWENLCDVVGREDSSPSSTRRSATPRSASTSRRRSNSGPATSGSSSSRRPISASLPSTRSRRRSTTPTTAIAAWSPR